MIARCYHLGFIILSVCVLTTCDDGEKPASYDNTEERKVFYERYNKKTREETAAKIEKFAAEIASTSDEQARLDAQKSLTSSQKKNADGDFFQWKDPSELPANLTWVTNDLDPEVGSPEAKKGGIYHTFIPGMAYPPTIRSLGKGGNNSFRSYHWDYIEMALVSSHPDTGNTIPAIADRWAIAEDKQTVYFHINDLAKWSDGEEIVTDDFFMSFYVYLSPYLTEQYYRTFFSEQFHGITSYGKDYICVRLANVKPKITYFANFMPFQTKFYREFGPDFEERYNWRPRPTAGAYQILPEDIKKGDSISLSRVKNWWAKDLKYYRYIYNPDKIEYKLIRDLEKAFVLFKRGEIELFPLGQPKFWYDKTEIPEVFDGYIEKATFFNEYPRSPYGLYFNQAVPLLANLDIRIGLQHSTNWQRVIDYDMRGDANRLHILNDGFGRFSNSNIVTREFSPAKAAEAFARAGYTQKDNDGYWKNAQGERLAFTISYSKSAFIDQIMQRIKEEAAKAGVEYKLESMDGTASFQKTSQKQHQIAFAAWGITPPFPDYYEFFHSKEAYEPGTKTPRTMTNNIFTYANPVMDKLVEANRNAKTEDEVLSTSHAIEEIIHNEAVMCTGWKKDFYRLAYWRWVKWPEKHNVRISDEPEMSYVFWIDQDTKEETLKAMREKTVFPEVNRVYDAYRVKAGGAAHE
jgi:microcin C transport system substrate-binding protein